MCRDGRTQAMMKGIQHTEELMRAIPACARGDEFLMYL